MAPFDPIASDPPVTQDPEPAPIRDTAGRFRPGCSGNPKGKPPGARNRATLWRESVEGDEPFRAARIVIDRALKGDVVAARFLCDRLEPRPRTRPLPVELDPAAPIAESFEAVFAAFAAGTISPEEAFAAGRVLDRMRAERAAAAEQRAAADDSARAARLAALEADNRALRAELAALQRPAAVAPAAPLNSSCIAPPPAAASHPAPAACRAPAAGLYSACMTVPSAAPPVAALPVRRRPRARPDAAAPPPPRIPVPDRCGGAAAAAA